MDQSEVGHILLPLRSMAAQLGVPIGWLRERARANDIPALRAGNRWLFRPDLVSPIVADMAARKVKGSTCG